MDSRFALPVNTIVDGAYRIERVVGSGGFGITYVAEDTKLGTVVALKEYYPIDFGDRDRTMSVRPKSDRHKKTFEWGRSNFLQEARTLARFEHPTIVRVTRVFEANSTAYMVMRFEQGQSFEAWLASLGRPPMQEELDRIAKPLLEALEMMHAENFLHRDIAPDNIIVRADGTPVLLDFGAARRAVAEMSRSLTGIVKAGYSPHEQYSSDGRLQGPWSDIYALGGTLYRAVTGRTPDEATLRVDVDHMLPAVQSAKGAYRPNFLSAIDSCLKVRSAERPQSVAQLRSKLLGETPKPSGGLEISLPTRKMPAERRFASRWLTFAASLLIVLGGAYGGYEYTIWQPGAQDAEAQKLAALIELRRKQAADAAQQQVEMEAEQRRKEADEAARRQAELNAERQRKEAEEARQQAELEAERQRKEAAEAAERKAEIVEEQRRKEAERIAAEEATRKAAAETARRQAELEVERRRKEAEEVARRQAEIEAERQRQEAAEGARRQAELAEEQRRKQEIARIAAEEAVRKAAAEAEATRAEEERRRIAAREPATSGDAAVHNPEAAGKATLDREALARDLQTALNRVGCYRGKIDGKWGTQGRAALAQFAKLTKHEVSVDEPSVTALEMVGARTGRVCPLECDAEQVERNGKCVEKPRPLPSKKPAQPRHDARGTGGHRVTCLQPALCGGN